MKENDVIIHSNLKVAAQLRIAAVLLRKTGRRRAPFAIKRKAVIPHRTVPRFGAGGHNQLLAPGDFRHSAPV